MLTLGRKFGESFFITHEGETIEVIIRKGLGYQVKVSFDGPLSFRVNRSELITGERKEARHDV